MKAILQERTDMNLRHAIAGAALAAVSVVSFAQQANPTPPAADQNTGTRGTNTPLIDKRDGNQQQRIQQGRQSGELTHREARKLKTEQKAVDHAQAKASADGNVTAKERHHIRRMQDKASKDIHAQRHDAAASAPAGK
jgi:hypothetical protein